MISMVNGTTTAGSAGTGGSPFISAGALGDGGIQFQSNGNTVSGGTYSTQANTDGIEFENTAAVAAYTVRLPAITGTPQQFVVGSLGGVSTLTLQTSGGSSITGAPTSLSASGSHHLVSDGSRWLPLD